MAPGDEKGTSVHFNREEGELGDYERGGGGVSMEGRRCCRWSMALVIIMLQNTSHHNVP